MTSRSRTPNASSIASRASSASRPRSHLRSTAKVSGLSPPLSNRGTLHRIGWHRLLLFGPLLATLVPHVGFDDGADFRTGSHLVHELGPWIRKAPFPHVDREAEARDHRPARDVHLLFFPGELLLRQGQEMLRYPGGDVRLVAGIDVCEHQH